MDTDDFINKSRAIHGEKYDYSKSVYVSSVAQVTIVCPHHGPFLQRPSNHLFGKGCKLCAVEKTRINLMLKSVGLPNGLSVQDYISAFTAKSMTVHGDQYDYSQSIYSFDTKKISIVCPVHGEFFQKPSIHMNGAGCKSCGDVERGRQKGIKFKKSFVERANKIHGNVYDYSKVEYVSSAQKVEIICPKHGSFFQRPNSHTRGIGCPDCGTEDMADKQRKTRKDFLREAKKAHGSTYDYSQVAYVSFHKHVTILCRDHGIFEQTPAGHLAGRGCVYCAAKINADRVRLDNGEFKKRAHAIHGDRYDYSQVDYVTNQTPVKIICSKHGMFAQQPSKHIDAKQGCPSCANRDMDLGKFIERSREIHDDKFDYSQSVYKGARKKIKIICPEHGVFEQAAHHHLNGIGCIECVDTLNSNGSQIIEKYLIKNKMEYEREKSFEGLVSGENSRYRLRWDFYLPDYKGFIEFDGQQHFLPNPHWGGEKAFRRVQRNDAIKNKWANENGFHLVRIRYDQVEEIQTILETEFPILKM